MTEVLKKFNFEHQLLIQNENIHLSGIPKSSLGAIIPEYLLKRKSINKGKNNKFNMKARSREIVKSSTETQKKINTKASLLVKK